MGVIHPLRPVTLTVREPARSATPLIARNRLSRRWSPPRSRFLRRYVYATPPESCRRVHQRVHPGRPGIEGKPQLPKRASFNPGGPNDRLWQRGVPRARPGRHPSVRHPFRQVPHPAGTVEYPVTPAGTLPGTPQSAAIAGTDQPPASGRPAPPAESGWYAGRRRI